MKLSVTTCCLGQLGKLELLAFKFNDQFYDRTGDEVRGHKK